MEDRSDMKKAWTRRKFIGALLVSAVAAQVPIAGLKQIVENRPPRMKFFATEYIVEWIVPDVVPA